MQLEACAGIYQVESGSDYQMKAGEDCLNVDIGNGSSLHFDPLAPLEFIDRRNIFTHIHFIKNASGNIEALEFKNRFGKVERFIRKKGDEKSEAAEGAQVAGV